MQQPTTRARTRFFPGSRTSLPTNVTFVQAVCANSGPTIDFPKSSASATPATNVKPGWAICGLQPFAHEFHHAALRAALVACQPNDKPFTTTAARGAVFAEVNVVWTLVPRARPRVFVKVSNAIKVIATSCSIDKLIAYPPKEIGATR